MAVPAPRPGSRARRHAGRRSTLIGALAAVAAAGSGACWLAPAGSSRALLGRREAALGLATLAGGAAESAVAISPDEQLARIAGRGAKAKAGEAGSFGSLSAASFAKLTKAAGLVQSQNLKTADESDLWSTIIDYHADWLEEPKVGARIYANSGDALFRLNLPQKALRDHNQAVRSDPTCGRCYVYRGMVLEALNRPEDAYKDYVKAVEVDPNCGVAWASYGQGLMARGDFPEAQKSLTKAIGLFQNKEPLSKDDERLDKAVPWAGLPRGFFYTVVNLAAAEYEVGDQGKARQRIDTLLGAMQDKPLPAAQAVKALITIADKGGTKAEIVDFESEKAWKQVEDADYRWHKKSYAEKSVAWGPKLTDALSALRANKLIAA